MKPAWEKLMTEWEDSKVGLVGDVDCTAAGESLCQKIGVEGYPTIKWGDPANLEDYEGERDLKGLKKWAVENLKPVCSPSNIDLCDDEVKEKIHKLQAMPASDLSEKIAEQEALLKAAEDKFASDVQKLQDTYTKLEEEKTAAVASIKDGGLGLMKAVNASKKGKQEL